MSENESTGQPDPALRLTITPEPTEEEAAAIAAALSIVSLASREPAESEAGTGSRLSPWVVTGRLAAHHAAPRARQRHWSRTLAWLERNHQ